MQTNLVKETRGIINNALLYVIVATGVNTSAENRQVDQGTLTNLIIDSINRNTAKVE